MINNLLYIFGTDVCKNMKIISGTLDDINTKVQDICNPMIDTINMPGPSIYYLFPYLFSPSFPVEENLTLSLCPMSVMCLDFCLFTDKLFDKQLDLSQPIYYNKILIYQQFIIQLERLSDVPDDVWKYYNMYFKENIRSVGMEENNHFGTINDYSWKEFCEIAKGKQALAKIIPALMGLKTGLIDEIKVYEEALDMFAIASQLYDDLRDWKEDFINKRFSWMLNKLIKDNDLSIDCDEKEISNILYAKNYDTEILDKANYFCEKAILAVKGNDVWVRFVRLLQIRINRLMLDLIKLKGHTIQSYSYGYRNDQNREMEYIMFKARDFIIGQYANGLNELKQWMFDTKSDINMQNAEVLPATIFQRSCMLNLLLEIKACKPDFITERIHDIIDAEVQTIINMASKRYDCGWVYCDGLYANCPDLDTLSEIIRISQTVGNVTLLKQVDDTLDKVIRINGDNVFFQSWIISENDFDYDIINKVFFRGGEVDVNANFIASLCERNPKFDKERIIKCLQWIYAKQNDKGTWDSIWYVGEYYCGYVLSKSFKVLNDEIVIERYLKFLYSTQNENGSWGDYQGNPLCTSYALLSIVNIGNKSEMTIGAVHAGLEYLKITNNSQGYWYGCEFIKMGNGKTDVSEQALRYRSATLTTMFCINAMCKGMQYLGGKEFAEFKVQ